MPGTRVINPQFRKPQGPMKDGENTDQSKGIVDLAHKILDAIGGTAYWVDKGANEFWNAPKNLMSNVKGRGVPAQPTASKEGWINRRYDPAGAPPGSAALRGYQNRSKKKY